MKKRTDIIIRDLINESTWPQYKKQWNSLCEPDMSGKFSLADFLEYLAISGSRATTDSFTINQLQKVF